MREALQQVLKQAYFNIAAGGEVGVPALRRVSLIARAGPCQKCLAHARARSYHRNRSAGHGLALMQSDVFVWHQDGHSHGDSLQVVHDGDRL